MQAWNGSCIRLFLNSDTKSVTVPAVSLPAVCAVESDECDNENIQLYSKNKSTDKYAYLKKKKDYSIQPSLRHNSQRIGKKE